MTPPLAWSLTATPKPPSWHTRLVVAVLCFASGAFMTWAVLP